ncbi:MAG: NAD(P)-dependent oxidoreductase [Caldilineaceae bacterium]
MTRILIEERAYARLESKLHTIGSDLQFVLMKADGLLYFNGQPITAAAAKPTVAWLNVDVARANLTKPFVETVLAAGTVKWLQTYNAGLDQPFYQAMFEQGIRISASSAQAIAIAEYVIANILACYQGIFERRRYQAAHQWQKTVFQELWHTRWLLCGFGNIGQAVAQRLRAFECQVVAVRRSGQAHPLADQVITLAQMAQHLPQVDGVVIASPLTAETIGLVNDAFFQRLKPGATLVNIARGKIVDQPALIDALNRGVVAHAILDVFDPEPLPVDSPLWDMENVLLSPHSSNAGQNTPLRGDLLFLENLRRCLANQPLLNEAYQ